MAQLRTYVACTDPTGGTAMGNESRSKPDPVAGEGALEDDVESELDEELDLELEDDEDQFERGRN